jgi:hypothetical protein
MYPFGASASFSILSFVEYHKQLHFLTDIAIVIHRCLFNIRILSLHAQNLSAYTVVVVTFIIVCLTGPQLA